MKFFRRAWPFIVFFALAISLIVLWSQRNAVGDWLALRSYDPPAEVQGLADKTTMTAYGKRLFYVNQPVLQDRADFNQHCKNDSDTSYVLGCYTGNRNGIYLFRIDTPELEGVEEVTAAHEMLHQAYDRLSVDEKKRVDELLQSFYDSGNYDETIRKQIDGYRQTEPDALLNEMHSIFATEVAQLPSELEAYYAQYFTDRQAVTALYAAYQGAFTQRKQQIQSYDNQLSDQKAEIDALQESLKGQLAAIDAQKAEMDRLRSAGNAAVYNQLVGPYNNKVDTYNQSLQQLKSLIASYNELVEKRNAVALEEQKLQQDLSSQQLPSMVGQ